MTCDVILEYYNLLILIIICAMKSETSGHTVKYSRYATTLNLIFKINLH